MLLRSPAHPVVIDWNPPKGGNSIGTLLYHIAGGAELFSEEADFASRASAVGMKRFTRPHHSLAWKPNGSTLQAGSARGR